MLPMILAGAVGLIALTKKPSAKAAQVGTPVSSPSSKANNQPAQPSQSYPWRPIASPRVDGGVPGNQPWYAGPRSFMSGPAETIQDLGIASGAAGTVIHNLSDIWGSLAPASSDPADDNEANLVSADSLPSNSPDLAASSGDQSNQVGSMSDDMAGSDQNLTSDYNLGVDTDLGV